ncbi:Zn finger protein [Exophiala dermatitidis]|nr:Zn finger protein [Exophiala dermatitidis]KAJ4556221.1 Zn finger protein [Exophiala dermatitidis]
MAANYSTQTYTIPQNPQLYASQQPSPANSASPTSPRMHEHFQQHAPNPYKQLRPLKSPLYVPAALRPTEHFSGASPMTPPKSLHDYPSDFETFNPDWVQEEELGEVTGPPTKEHWKAS